MIHHLPLHPPFDWAGTLDWYAVRTVPGVEVVADGTYTRGVAVASGPGVVGIRAGHDCLLVETDVDGALADVRRVLELDRDPAPADAALARVPALAPLVAARPGVRIPGTWTPFEALMRALTGQQVTVAAGRAALGRMVEAVGLEPGLRPFPEPAEVLAAGFDWYAGPAARRRAIADAVALAAAGGLAGEPEEVAPRLLAVHGIGPWTVAYTLMRGFGALDVDLSGDRALVVAAERLPGRPSLREVLAAARPWRSLAALHLWAS